MNEILTVNHISIHFLSITKTVQVQSYVANLKFITLSHAYTEDLSLISDIVMIYLPSIVIWFSIYNDENIEMIIHPYGCVD